MTPISVFWDDGSYRELGEEKIALYAELFFMVGTGIGGRVC